jgi:hypothetical protein
VVVGFVRTVKKARTGSHLVAFRNIYIAATGSPGPPLSSVAHICRRAGGVLVLHWRTKYCPARSGVQPGPPFSSIAHICGPPARTAGTWLADCMIWPRVFRPRFFDSFWRAFAFRPRIGGRNVVKSVGNPRLSAGIGVADGILRRNCRLC